MRRTRVAAAATASLVATATALSLTTSQAGAAPDRAPSAQPSADQTTKHSDNRIPGWRAKYDDIQRAAVEKRLRTGGKGAVEKVAKGTYGKVAQTGTDRIFVVLAEFGETRHSAYPDDPESGAQRFTGPLHNEIPKPNRKVDNSTLWNKNFNRQYFENMYFSRMDKFYREQSGGIYGVDGDVTEWVKVPFNAARYGSNNGVWLR